MNIIESQTKVLRFDFNKDYITVNRLPFREKINVRYESGIDENGYWIGIRWTVNFIDNKTNDEILGILSEKRASIKAEEKQKDLEHLRNFISNSFLNVRIYYQDNAPHLHKNISFSQPNIESIAENLQVDLEKLGVWK